VSPGSQDQARLQAALADIARLAVAGGDVTALMDDAIGIVHDRLRVDFATVVEFEPDRVHLRLRAGRGWVGRDPGDRLEVAPDSPFSWTLDHGSVHIPDRDAETRFDAQHPTLLANGIHASLSFLLPGMRPDEPFGIIGVHSKAPRVFTELEQEFLRGAAAVLSAAIARHRQALEMNDTVLQGLAVARYALARDDQALAEEAVGEALVRARALVSELLGGTVESAPALPGDLRRR
jgi:GAF domain-containing protein